MNELKWIAPFSDAADRNTEITYEQVKKQDGSIGVVPVIRYRLLNRYSHLLHGFSTRLGGVSTGDTATLNFSFSREKNRENVLENHRIFGEAVGYDAQKAVCSDQVHGTKLHVVTKEDMGKGVCRDSDLIGIDGLLTNEKQIPLLTFYADCVPLYFYDPVHEVAAVAHSGWRGTVEKIGKRMVEKMHEVYDSKPEDIVCAIGPSICKDCYEVGEELYHRFSQVYSPSETEQLFYDRKDGKFQLDLHLACKFNFLDAGILEEHIAMPDLCTCCNSSFLFSHRATGGKRGNLCAVIMLR